MRGLLLCAIVSGMAAGCYRSVSIENLRDVDVDTRSDLAQEPDSDPEPDPEPDPVIEPMLDPELDLGCLDRDGDTYPDEACGGEDCNDADPTVYPGAHDICEDGIDQDCDGFDAVEGVRGEPIILYYHNDPGSFDPRVETELAWTGSEYIVFWRTYMEDGAYLDRIDARGKGVADEVRIRDYHWEFVAAWSGSVFGTAWIVWEDASSRLYYQSVATDGSPLTDEVLVSELGADSHDLVIQSADAEFALIWTDGGSDLEQVYMTRVDGSGAMLIPSTEISSPTTNTGNSKAAIWTGSNLGVIWPGVYGSSYPHRRLYFRAVNSMGYYLTDAVVIHDDADYTHEQSLHWTGSQFGAFWNDSGPHDGHEITYKRFDGDGSLINESELLTFPDYHLNSPAAAWTGHDYGLFWSQNHDYFVYSLHLQRVTLDGSLHGRSIPIHGEDHLQEGLEIVWSEHEFGICWTERFRDEGDNHIRLYFARAGFCD